MARLWDLDSDRVEVPESKHMEEERYLTEDPISSAILRNVSTKPVPVNKTETADSESFQKWFGHSKVCDIDGGALMAGRNSSSRSKWFPDGGSRVFGQLGEWYGTHAFSSEDDLDANEPPLCSFSECAYLCIENPREFTDIAALGDAAEGKWGPTSISRMRKLRVDLKKQGYDGIVVRMGSPCESLDLWAPFDRQQIKLAKSAPRTSAT